MFKKYRSVVLFMLFLAGVVNYLDRSALSIAAPLISKEFNLDAAQLGITFSIFFAGYTLFNFIGGYLSDRFGPHKVLTGSMSLWSLACGATALTWNFGSLLIVRTIFGMGEGPIGSNTNKTINNWFPKKERAKAVGIGTCGMPLGGAIASPIIGFLALKFGWRLSFIAIVVIGFIWVFLWAKFVTDYPRQNSRISKEEVEEIESDQETVIDTSEKKPLGYYLRQPLVLFTAFGFFAYNYILYFFLTWFPSYLTMSKHLSIQDMSIATIIPWVIACVGAVSGGALTDYLYKKTNKLLFSRKIVLVTGLLGSAVTISLTGFADSAVAAVALMSVGICFLYITGPSYWAIIQDNVTGKNVGAVGGFVHALANISGIIAPIITGYIVKSTNSFTSAFILSGVLGLIAAITIAFFANPIKKNVNASLEN